jgi:hypothetical protein
MISTCLNFVNQPILTDYLVGAYEDLPYPCPSLSVPIPRFIIEYPGSKSKTRPAR